MKRNKKIILIIAIIVFFISVAFGIYLLISANTQKATSKKVSTMGYGQLGDPKELSDLEKMVGCVSITDYGANGNDDLDDTWRRKKLH